MEEEHSNQLKDISILSSKSAIITTFNVSIIITRPFIERKLNQSTKLLGVKHRARGKYEMLIPLATLHPL